MADLTLTTFDWVPEMPRGYVRDQMAHFAAADGATPEAKGGQS
jgi:glutathione S-transferase